MVFAFENQLWFKVSYEATCWFALIFCISLLLTYVCGLTKDSARNKLLWLNISCFVFYILVELMASIEMIMNHTNCRLRVQFFTLGYIGAKLSLYSILILRIQLAFQGSTHAYSPIFLGALKFYLFILFVIFLTCGIYYNNGVITTLSHCTFTPPVWYLEAYILNEFGISFLCLGLTLRPLLKLAKSNADKMSNKSGILIKLAIKYTVLTSVSTTSSFIAVVAAELHLYHLNRVDDMINCLCLLLMTKSHDPAYQVLCKTCHACCSVPFRLTGHISSTQEPFELNEDQDNGQPSTLVTNSKLEIQKIASVTSTSVDTEDKI